MPSLLLVVIQTLLLSVSLPKACFGWAPNKGPSPKTTKTSKNSPKLYYKDASFAPFTDDSPTAFVVQAPSFSSTIGRLPWSKDDKDSEDPVFLSHWNWQLDYFQKHLTNAKVRNNSKDAENDEHKDLYYVNDGKGHHVYTISLASDEYRDIRMTYMKFPTSQIFRCLAYPSDGSLPILGMGIMKFGTKDAKHMAILDYQPLHSSSVHDDDRREQDMEDLYTSELLRMRADTPSMSQPMTHRHFDTDEERKFFTETPLLGRWNTDDDASEEEATNMERSHKDFVATHVELTQKHAGSCPSPKQEELLQKHSEFDTHVSMKEPAGRFLCSAYGNELGHRLVHNVIFPLSTN